ncbi:MAG: hypothetical protein J5905_00835 [Prevotella sp.]|nr:hypothetical protein [Prevotella sp.]
MQYAPIALFTYNRADHTKQAVESLLKNAEAKDSDLFIFSDGPKNEKAKKGVEENRSYIRSLKNENDLEISQSRDTENAHSSVSLVNYHKENKFSQDNSSIPSDDSQSASLRKEPSASDDATQSNTPSLNIEGRGESFKSVTIIEREKNWGLANSLIAGITEIVNKYGRVIVVEDDLILSPYFLQFMNEALEKYKDDDRVASISAFLNPIDCEAPETFFLRYFACWGWATWKRGWDILINDDRVLLKRLRWKKIDFNIGGTGPFYGILYCDKIGLNDSWAVRFYASQFLAGKLQLFPGKTMAIQTGMDGTGTHSEDGEKTYCNMCVCDSPITLNDIPVEESREMYEAFSRFYGKGQRRTVRTEYERMKSFIRRLLGIDYR